MKKFFYLAGAAMFLASCSNEADVVENTPNVTPEEELAYAPEMIQLGTNARVSAGTRATVLDAWNGEEIGVLALCSEATLDGSTWDDVVTINNKTTDNQPAILKGAKATVKAEMDTENPTANIVALDGAPKYYPRSSSRNYRFYGYYPYAAPTWDAEAGTYTVSGAFDGQQDIVAGVSNLVDNGWNAKYVRALKGDGETYVKPNIHFTHMTAQFQIFLKTGKSYDGTKAACQIKSVSIDLPTKYDLVMATQKDAGTADEVLPALTVSGDSTEVAIVASGVDPVLNGTSQVGNKTVSSMIVAWNETDDAAELSGKTNPYNDAIFVPASDDPDQEYTLYVTFGDDVVSPVSFKYSDIKQGSQVDATESTFSAGKAYYIVLTINGPEEILLTATLAPWVSNGQIDLEI